MREAPYSQVSGGGWEFFTLLKKVGVEEGETDWRLKTDFSPSLSSKSRPEGHPKLWLKLNHTAVGKKKLPTHSQKANKKGPPPFGEKRGEPREKTSQPAKTQPTKETSLPDASES